MAAKIFPYSVIYNGTLIPANTPIECEEDATSAAEEKPNKKKPAIKRAVTKRDSGTS